MTKNYSMNYLEIYSNKIMSVLLTVIFEGTLMLIDLSEYQGLKLLIIKFIISLTCLKLKNI